VVVPPALTIYFYFIWQYFISPDPERINYGHRNARWVYYSWFVVGVFGLNISKYGLAGVEASMLHERPWQVHDGMVLLMHSGQSWAGFSGWAKCLNSLFRHKQRMTQRLWYLLCFLSLMIWIALPISGLSLELFDGYFGISDHPMVIGYQLENFNHRLSTGSDDPYYQTINRGIPAWSSGAPVTLPGIGIAYTASYLNRDKFDFLNKLPNSLPLEEGIPDIFLAPQAKYPVSGKSWGLRLGYNCSIVTSASEFTILSKKASAIQVNPGLKDTVELMLPEPGQRIIAFNNSNDRMYHNLWSYAEMGISTDRWTPYYGNESSYFDDKESREADIFEYALWQIRRPSDSPHDRTFDDTIGASIAGFGQPFIQADNGSILAVNETFFLVAANNSLTKDLFPSLVNPSRLQTVLNKAPPIGVRCRRISALGTAQLEASDFSFHSFVGSPRPPFDQSEEERETPRFGGTTTGILMARYEDLFRSTHSPAPVVWSATYQYTSFLQPDVLLQSIMRAHATDALQLMYDGINNFAQQYEDLELTSSKPGKILGPGVVPPIVPAILLSIWALGCLILGCMYGFRRRWSETLDGFSFLRFGADLSDDLRRQSGFTSTASFEECDWLRDIPGLVGDSKISVDIGRIGLVRRGNYARKDKLYM
jgi:hypothetical protein